MDLLHPEFAHGQSEKTVLWAIEQLETGIAAGRLMNARYDRVKGALGSAYWDEHMAMSKRQRPPDSKHPAWDDCWRITGAAPFQLIHVHTTERKLEKVLKAHAPNMEDPLAIAARDAVLKFAERWSAVRQLVIDAKPFVVKGREINEDSKAPERTVDNTGTCCVCERNIKLANDNIVDHGFRVGDGERYGQCPGVGFAPFEISPAGTKAYLVALEQREAGYVAHRKGLDSPDLMELLDLSLGVPRKVRRDDTAFPGVLRRAIASADYDIKAMGRQLDYFRKKVQDWVPTPLPDGRREHLEGDASSRP